MAALAATDDGGGGAASGWFVGWWALVCSCIHPARISNGRQRAQGPLCSLPGKGGGGGGNITFERGTYCRRGGGGERRRKMYCFFLSAMMGGIASFAVRPSPLLNAWQEETPPRPATHRAPRRAAPTRPTDRPFGDSESVGSSSEARARSHRRMGEHIEPPAAAGGRGKEGGGGAAAVHYTEYTLLRPTVRSSFSSFSPAFLRANSNCWMIVERPVVAAVVADAEEDAQTCPNHCRYTVVLYPPRGAKTVQFQPRYLPGTTGQKHLKSNYMLIRVDGGETCMRGVCRTWHVPGTSTHEIVHTHVRTTAISRR